jgi:asparagine synthase (glutamine-hydrolysing)
MSGIYGVIHFKKSNHLVKEIPLMISCIKHRGINGIDTWQSENAAMTHLMMHTTPESVNEKQPLVNESGLVLVADARIDNREELIEELAIKSKKEISDVGLIMIAYEQWGNDCVYKLIGDFTFVIWNPLTQKIFIGSDHLGVRPLYYYYEKDNVFAFASEIKALIALNFVPKEFDKLEVATYLVGLHDFRPMTGRTIYKSIQFALPAHYMLIDNAEIENVFYWHIDKKRFSHLISDADFVEEFRKTFEESVRCRIRSPFKIASHLSGGLDSSSIACVARNILKESKKTLHTYHMDVEIAQCNEQDYAESAIEMGGFEHKYTKISEYDFVESAREVSMMTDLPNSFVVPPAAQLGWMKAAQTDNCRIFLTGHEGDTIVDYGFRYLEETLLTAQYDLFEAHLEKLSAYAINYNYFDDISNWTLKEKKGFVRRIVVGPILAKLKQQKKYLKITQILVYMRKSFSFTIDFLKDKYKKNQILNYEGYRNLNSKFLILSESFKQDTDIQKYAQNLQSDYATKAGLQDPIHKEHFSRIYSHGMTHFCQILEQCGVYHGFKIAHPFLDRRLIELSLMLPSTLNFNDGMLRGTVRESMRGILPEKIRTRTAKMDFTPLLAHIVNAPAPAFEKIIEDFFVSQDFTNTWLLESDLLKRIEIYRNPKYPNELKERFKTPLFRSIYFLIYRSTLKHLNQ